MESSVAPQSAHSLFWGSSENAFSLSKAEAILKHDAQENTGSVPLLCLLKPLGSSKNNTKASGQVCTLSSLLDPGLFDTLSEAFYPSMLVPKFFGALGSRSQVVRQLA